RDVVASGWAVGGSERQGVRGRAQVRVLERGRLGRADRRPGRQVASSRAARNATRRDLTPGGRPAFGLARGRCADRAQARTTPQHGMRPRALGPSRQPLGLDRDRPLRIVRFWQVWWVSQSEADYPTTGNLGVARETITSPAAVGSGPPVAGRPAPA